MCLHLYDLKDTILYFEAFSVSGMTEDELFKLDLHGRLSKISVRLEKKSNFTINHCSINRTKKNCFSEMSEKNLKETLHRLKKNLKDRTFLWKESRSGSGNLQNSVELERTHGDKRIIEHFMKYGSQVRENSIWALNEKTVLVVAELGMGKSSTTTQVAWNQN
jgi:hypothetical protein